MNRPDPAVLRLLIFLGSLIATIVLVITFRKIFQPLLLGLGLAYLLDPWVSWFEDKGRSRTFGAIAIAVVLVLGLVAFFVFLVPTVGEQVDRLEEKLPEYQAKIRGQVEPWLTKLEARYPEELDEMQQRLVQGLKENLPRLAGRVGRSLQQLVGNLFELLLFILNLIFVPVFAFYLLVDWPEIKRGMRELVPVAYRPVITARVNEVDSAIASFLRGQLVIAIILGLINAVGLTMLGVPFGFLIGLVAGFANIVPYMALIVGLTPALMLCWVEHQSLAMLVGVVAIFGGAQLLEGTVLGPRILSKSVNLHPVWVLLAVIAGGSLFGFIGMLIAVPAAAAIKVFARHWVEVYKASRVYQSEPSPPGVGS